MESIIAPYVAAFAANVQYHEVELVSYDDCIAIMDAAIAELLEIDDE